MLGIHLLVVVVSGQAVDSFKGDCRFKCISGHFGNIKIDLFTGKYI